MYGYIPVIMGSRDGPVLSGTLPSFWQKAGPVALSESRRADAECDKEKQGEGRLVWWPAAPCLMLDSDSQD